jgi:cellulose synthase/poly-beta-1,6-N-acetylglucosamine synthase-like glycosyltransferase
MDRPLIEPSISFVVIGLNEAENLAASIASLSSQGFDRNDIEILYVDSGSDDDSVAVARRANADVQLAIPRRGANAARARNAGLAKVRAPFVHFVDGDTRLEPGWARIGVSALETDPGLVGVEGSLRELQPDTSLYDAVCELDWPSTQGPVDYVGGNALYRTQPLREIGGFDPDLRAGEEPELGARLRRHGWRMQHLDADMARHHLDIRSLGPYLRRNYVSGVACALVAGKTGGLRRGAWSHRLRRTLGLAALLMGPIVLALPLSLVSPRGALLLLAVGPSLLIGLATRKAIAQRRRGSPARLAVAFGLHAYISKIPAALGILSVTMRPVPAHVRSNDANQGEPGATP